MDKMLIPKPFIVVKILDSNRVLLDIVTLCLPWGRGWVRIKNVMSHHRQPKLSGNSLDFEFRRGSMKTTKISLKFHFSTEIDIKMTYRYLVFVFCYLMSLGL